MIGAINAAGIALVASAGAFAAFLLMTLMAEGVRNRVVVQVLVASAVVAVVGAALAGYAP